MSTLPITARAAEVDRWYQLGWYHSSTVAQVFEQAVTRTPTSVVRWYIDNRPISLTFAEIGDAVQRAAQGLRRLGLDRGSRIVIKVTNCPEGLIALHAAWRAGLVPVPVLPTYGANELNFILETSAARALVLAGNSHSLADLESFGPLPHLDLIVSVDDESLPRSTPWSALLDESGVVGDDRAGDDATSADDPDGVCAMLFTSGSTDRPKAVLHTHNSLLARALDGIPGCDEGEWSELTPMPAGHIGGLVRAIRTFALPVRTIYVHPWNAEVAMDLIASESVASVAVTPFFLQALVEAQRRRPRATPALRHVMVGGTNVRPVDVDAADSLGWRTVRSYGSTEHPMAFVGHVSDDVSLRRRVDGRAACGADVRIVGRDGSAVPPGEIGEILLRGPAQCAGYLDGDQTANAFTADGWFKTGDLGTLDDDGNIAITGRIKDIIIRGGENISAPEVEEILRADTRVVDAAVVGYPDERYGERACAFVVLTGQLSDYGVDEVFEHFRRRGVDVRKTPERVIILDELPRTANGKVAKQDLRARLTSP